MRIALFTLGLSPPIAIEFLLKLLDHGVKCERGISVTTKGAAPSFHALKIALHWSSRATDLFPQLSKNLLIRDLSYMDLSQRDLELNDISKPGDCRTFRTRFNSALRDAVKWAQGDVDKVYVCVAGGRKTMPIDAVLTSTAEGIRNVCHIIAPKIPGITTEFADLVIGKIDEVNVDDRRLSRDELLEKLSKYAEEPEKAEKDIIKYSIELCFPPKNLEFHLVKIPIPRLTPEERKRFRSEILL